MFYKKDEDNNWHVANVIHFPDGEVLNESNRHEIWKDTTGRDGWIWYDVPPEEYTNWLEERDEPIA